MSYILQILLINYTTNEYLINIISLIFAIAIVLLNLKVFVRKDILSFIRLNKNFSKKDLMKLGLVAFLSNFIFTMILIVIKQYNIYNFIWDKLYIEDVIKFILIGIFISFVAVFIEEIIIRGYVLNRIPFKPLYSAIIAAIFYTFFGIFQKGFNTIFILNLFGFSLMLNLIYILYGNLLYTIFFNFVWYFTSNYVFSLTLNPKMLDMPSIINLTYKDYNVIGGGNYGIFGSVIFLAIILIANYILFNNINRNVRWFSVDISIL